MPEIRGKGVCSTCAIGRLYYLSRVGGTSRHIISAEEDERQRFEKAKCRAIEQLRLLHERLVDEIGVESARIFNVHMIMLSDEDFCNAAEEAIANGASAEAAVSSAARTIANMLKLSGNDYMVARTTDIFDIERRMLLCLCEEDDISFQPDEPVILVADDLTPSELMQFDRAKLIGIVMLKGNTNSHTSILARSSNIPAMIARDELDETCSGKPAIIDGNDGVLIIDPTERQLRDYREIIRSELDYRLLLQEYKGKKSITRKGKKIDIFANVNGSIELNAAVENDAEGIGLYRSEFLYLGQLYAPSEDEQVSAYKCAAQKLADKPVIIRALDVGADKQIPFITFPEEENPALGFRGIRVLLTYTDLFRTQLRAIMRAAVYGNIMLMLPMITSVDELLETRAIISDVDSDLSAQGIPHRGDVPVGVMIETPAAAIISDQLAKHADFFSIGTNDLTQYTYAVDRQDSFLDHCIGFDMTAVMRLIMMTVTNAKKKGIKVSICGELAADLSLTSTFIDMGVDSLSVSSTSVLAVRRNVIKL